MSRRNSISRYPQQPGDWDKVALKYQRVVAAEEARGAAKILQEIAAKKLEQAQFQLRPDKREAGYEP